MRLETRVLREIDDKVVKKAMVQSRRASGWWTAAHQSRHWSAAPLEFCRVVVCVNSHSLTRYDLIAPNPRFSSGESLRVTVPTIALPQHRTTRSSSGSTTRHSSSALTGHFSHSSLTAVSDSTSPPSRLRIAWSFSSSQSVFESHQLRLPSAIQDGKLTGVTQACLWQ